MEELIETTLKQLLDAANFQYGGVVRNDVAGQMVFSIQTDDARALIGMHGDTVQALDYLVKKIVEQRTPHETSKADADSETVRFLIDVNDYRTKQIKDLQNKALMMAERARSLQYDVELSPMSSYERLIIHTTLQGAASVKTESQGEGRSRRVVIRYANASN